MASPFPKLCLAHGSFNSLKLVSPAADKVVGGREKVAMATTLWSCLGKVHDRRSRQGQRYSLRSVLGLSIAAVLGGCSTLGAIAHWIKVVAEKGLLGEFDIESGRPCQATLHYIFTDLNVKSFERALARWVSAVGMAPDAHVAIDAKTARGSGFADYPGAHMIAAYCEELKGVVGQLKLETGMNEITAALALIKRFDLEGKVVTGDAMFCQRSISRAILKAGGDYVFPVKDNQPELKADIQVALAEPCSPLRSAHPAA